MHCDPLQVFEVKEIFSREELMEVEGLLRTIEGVTSVISWYQMEDEVDKTKAKISLSAPFPIRQSVVEQTIKNPVRVVQRTDVVSKAKSTTVWIVRYLNDAYDDDCAIRLSAAYATLPNVAGVTVFVVEYEMSHWIGASDAFVTDALIRLVASSANVPCIVESIQVEHIGIHKGLE